MIKKIFSLILGILLTTILIVLSPLIILFEKIEFLLRRCFKKKSIQKITISEPKPLTKPISSRYVENPNVKFNLENLPEGIRLLIPYAKKWAIGDDEERVAFEESLTFDEKKDFIDTVSPMIDEIEEYCSKYREIIPIPDDVVLLDMMMEAFSEVGCEIYPNTNS